MSLGREVDYPTWVAKILRNEHLADANFARFARIGVLLEVPRKIFPEYQSDAFAHDTNRVDGIHNRFHICFKQVTSDKPNH